MMSHFQREIVNFRWNILTGIEMVSKMTPEMLIVNEFFLRRTGVEPAVWS